MRKKIFILLTTTLCLIAKMHAQPGVIAHRGYWKVAGSAQNSIAALVKADSIGCYGSEFDVRLTADNQLIVNHDPQYKCKKIENNNAADLVSLKLSNGEPLPTLEAYLHKAQQLPDIHLILELKPHNTPERETEAVKLILEMVDRFHLINRIDFISFSLHAIKEFIRLSPGSRVYYLNGDLSPQELKKIGCTGMDYSLRILKKHPQWINEARQLGLKTNAWTINKETDMKWLIEEGVDFITTDHPLLLQRILNE